MRAKEYSLTHLLDQRAEFQVPLYQRPYEWKDKHWKRLWDDLCKTYELAQSEDEKERAYRHYFGSIVTRGMGGAHGVHFYHLIDGQQRLTTTSLLLRAILNVWREKIGEENHVVPDEYRRLRGLLFNRSEDAASVTDAAAQHYLAMKLGEHDMPAYFRAMGLADAEVDANETEQITPALDYFTRKFTAWYRAHVENSECPGTVMAQLTQVIREKLVVAWIELEEFDSDYEVFASLNTAGLALAESDKIRNFCFMHMDVEGREEEQRRFHKDVWLPMERTLKPKKKGKKGKGPSREKMLDEFMTYWTIMRTGRQFDDDKLFDQIHEYLAHNLQVALTRLDDNVAEKVASFFTEMCGYAPAYKNLSSPESIGASKLRHALTDLQGPIGLKTAAHPLLLSLMHTYCCNPEGQLEDMCRCVSMMESFVVRKKLCRVGGKQFNRIFKTLGYKHYNRKCQLLQESAQWLQEELGRMSQLTTRDRFPSDDEFRQAFRETEVFRDGPLQVLIRHVLLRIERRRNSAPAGLVETELSVEHIMPEEIAGTAWVESLGADAMDVHRRRRHTMANLTLLKHDDLGQLPFEEKVTQKYRNSEIQITKELAENWTAWDEASMNQRAEQLAATAIELWPIPVSSS